SDDLHGNRDRPLGGRPRLLQPSRAPGGRHRSDRRSEAVKRARMSTFLGDLKDAARTLARTPGIARTARLTPPLGGGGTPAVFCAVNALVLRPRPFPEPDRLVFGLALREGFDPFGTSLLEYAAYKESAGSFASSGLSQGRSYQIAEGGEPERVSGAAVTAAYLQTDRVAPPPGRRVHPGESPPRRAQHAF